jgi:uncharacterized protein (DUF2147 family)
MTLHRFLFRLTVMLLVSFALIGTSAAQPSSSITGYWLTIDDDGKTPTGVVYIFQRDNKLYGDIVQLINPPRKDPKCDDCEGAARGKPVLGLQIIWGLTKSEDGYSNGRILDPKNGKVYRCQVELQDGGGRLKVRGYVGISLLGRTQYWKRTAKPS